jgi:hypothetical protein
LDAEISQRHLSFVESGRASPSRELVIESFYPADEASAERLAKLQNLV